MQVWRFLGLLVLVLMIVSAGVGCDDDDDDDNNDDTTGDDDDDNDDDNDNDDDDNDTAGDDDDDDDENLAQWLKDRPYLQNRSLWAQEIDMADPPLVRTFGAMGVGNGKVFGILGDQSPFAGWHNLGGPNYQKDFKWFTDKRPHLYVGDREALPLRQAISRVRNSAVVITEAKNGVVEWTSVNFAPIGADDVLAEDALVSVWIVRNISQMTLEDVALRVDSYIGRFDAGLFTESDYTGRTLSSRPLEVDALAGESGKQLVVPIGSLTPGQEKVVTLPLAFTIDTKDAAGVFAALENAGLDALLEATVQWWDQWASQITVFNTPDQKFNDLMQAQAVAIKINQAVSGAVAEMSQYSNTWLRDLHGPSLYYPLIGLNDDFKDMVDYMWGAMVLRGGIPNAMEVDLDVSNLPAQPDWDNLGVMNGRTRAESPSALVLEYENYYRATGDTAPIIERWGMLKHALLKQKYVDDCLLHFSSDETFEDLMEAVFGENFLAEPDESTLSSYSSLLVIRAGRFLAEMAADLGYTDDQVVFEDLVEGVTTCLEDTYWMPANGRYAVKAQTDTREPFAQPYEDVNTMPIWLSALPLDNPRVVSNFESTLEILGHANGLLYSPLPPLFRLLMPHAEEGVLTGMSHGYWLNNLDKMFHPLADEAFARWRNVFTKTGFTDEAVIVDDFGHLWLLREPFGAVCDISGRFRSWESGIMGYAFLYHLTGIDVSVPEQRVGLAPHLPDEWDEFSLDGLAYGAGRFDLEVSRSGAAGRIVVVATDAAFDLVLTVPVTGAVTEVLRDGAALPGTAYEVETNAYGRTIVRLAPIALTAGDAVEIEVIAAL
ncbi:MAG: hypothetical protein P9L99_05530 [Candidatus Lernaella stagnicola]|nr:hypothetical protein [Candidatus Lernaella stagnicola]